MNTYELHKGVTYNYGTVRDMFRYYASRESHLFPGSATIVDGYEFDLKITYEEEVARRREVYTNDVYDLAIRVIGVGEDIEYAIVLETNVELTESDIEEERVWYR